LFPTHYFSAIIEQVLTGKQGCGGVLRSWILNKSKATKNDQQALMNLEKLCERAVFLAAPNIFKQLITDNCKGDEKRFIENLSILRVASTYRDQVLEILPETRAHVGRKRVSTYDALMSGKKCLLKLHQHSKEEVLRADALKTVPLRKEIEILKVLSAEPCPNLVRLLGSRTKAPMHMIIERTPKGDLLTYLEGLAALATPPEAELLLQIALDVCNAMIFLGARDIIHRDLCAKNCFVFMQDGKLLTKLGDFHLAVLSYTDLKSPTGLSRQPTSFTEHFPNQFAVRWMAIEALQFREFSIASDVWAFGVLLFEIFTFGCKPYVNMPSGLSLDRDEQVEEFVSTLHNRKQYYK
jgi:serine/threonine protein kinase